MYIKPNQFYKTMKDGLIFVEEYLRLKTEQTKVYIQAIKISLKIIPIFETPKFGKLESSFEKVWNHQEKIPIQCACHKI